MLSTSTCLCKYQYHTMFPFSFLCNPCLSHIISLRVDSFTTTIDDGDYSTDYHDHSNRSLCSLCNPKLFEPSPLQFTDQDTLCLPVVGKQFCSSSLAVWTVRKKPLLFSGGGLMVTDSCTGQIIFRVDGRGSSFKHRLILMDAVGKPLLTLHRKALRMYNRWDGFCGEKYDGQKPIFSVRKSSMFSKNEIAEVFVGSKTKKKSPDYKVRGSYRKRYCTIYNGSTTIVAEVKRKLATSDVMLSKDVFSVVVKGGLDQAFIMGLVVIVDQMSGENE